MLRPFLRPIIHQLDRQSEMVRLLAKSEMQTRAMLKREMGKSINVVFVCHSPSLWGKLSPAYKALRCDSAFNISLVAVPYKRDNFGSSECHDEGIADYTD